MSTEEQTAASAPARGGRDHPTAVALAGFFTGLVYVILVPGAYAGLLSLLLDTETAESLFPLVLIALVVPIGLTLAPRTRRFGQYFLIGIASTALVVLATAAVVLWVLYRTDG